MARYAEWNKFIGNLKTDKYGVTNVNEVGIAFEKATADVVPKSEVIRMLDEIYKEADQTGTAGVFLYGIRVKVVELKKKYTEEQL